MTHVCGDEALQAFREHWTGEQILHLLHQCGGRLRIDWAVGVGKSVSIDQTIEAAVRQGQYDLVVVLSPTRRLLEERQWVHSPPPEVRIVNLKPRPRRLCGEERDSLWQPFEKKNLGALGRQKLCGPCPHVKRCFWPRQYGKALQGVQVIFATQAHLERSSTFLAQVQRWTQATRMLVLLDEINFMITSFRRRILHTDLHQFAATLRHLPSGAWGSFHHEWIFRVDLLLRAPTADLRAPEWRMPPFPTEWAVAVQDRGWEAYGEQFNFLGYDLTQFGESPLDSRERTPTGDLLFAAPPYLSCDFVVYSGTAEPKFTQFRIGQGFASPFADYRFNHPDTVWYNLASTLGMRRHFLRNAKQILDFFAALVAQRLQEGRRPLLVAKKCFVSFCAREIERRLRAGGLVDVQVAWDQWERVDLSAPHVVPLIHFGMIGTNQFEHFDCAYCLTGYYVNEEIVNTVLQDILASDGFLPILIETRGRPRRRIAGVVQAQHQVYDVHHLAQQALNHQEMDVVLQAVGRVRPYTRPREIFTFQCAAHPQLPYTQEFHTLGEARRFFALSTHRTRLKDESAGRVQAARTQGLTQTQAARSNGVSLRTIKRYWNTGG